MKKVLFFSLSPQISTSFSIGQTHSSADKPSRRNSGGKRGKLDGRNIFGSKIKWYLQWLGKFCIKNPQTTSLYRLPNLGISLRVVKIQFFYRGRVIKFELKKQRKSSLSSLFPSSNTVKWLGPVDIWQLISR